MAARELGDVDRAASLLCAAARSHFPATRVGGLRQWKRDLWRRAVAPAAAEAASGVASAAREAAARAEKYLERLRKLRQRREALEKALGDEMGGDEVQSGAFGRPGTQRERDDDVRLQVSRVGGFRVDARVRRLRVLRVHRSHARRRNRRDGCVQ